MSNVKNHKITIITSNTTWMNKYIPELAQRLKPNEVQWIHNTTELCNGDICFILSFEKILKQEHLDFHKHNIVVHASDLPQGKGMSPLSWQILEGKNNITLTLFNAVEKLDAGKIYFQDYLQFEGHELLNEMQHLMGEKICAMCLEFVRKYSTIINEGKDQVGESTFYKRRYPIDSKLDIDKTIREQFNLFRIVDNEKYPAFFEFADHRYILKIEKETK
jgi:methionyl-tRNA formyltransferase